MPSDRRIRRIAKRSGLFPGSERIPMVPNGSIKENRRVLLIENTQTDRLLLRNWLTAERIEVYEAVDIITGLAACPQFQPNLILVQIRLPTWDGYEVIRRLKDDPRTLSIPVIFIAASRHDGGEGQGDRHGGGRFHLEAVRPGRAARPGPLGAADQGATSTCSSSGRTSTA